MCILFPGLSHKILQTLDIFMHFASLTTYPEKSLHLSDCDYPLLEIGSTPSNGNAIIYARVCNQGVSKHFIIRNSVAINNPGCKCVYLYCGS